MKEGYIVSRENIGNELQGQQITKNIWLCPDGVYRWHYAFDMLRNPTVLFTVWKVLGIAFGAVYLFSTILTLIENGFSGEKLWAEMKPFLILAAVFFVISIIAYGIVAASYGWKYQVLFEMTEEKVTHIQMQKQFEEAQAIGWLTALAGAATGNLSMTGLGIDAAAKDKSVSEFKSVTSVKVRRRRHTIYVNQTLEKNQVYAGDEDFEFVLKYILDRCTKAKVK